MEKGIDHFAGHKSLCSERQKEIVSKEKRSKHVAVNKVRHLVRQYQIDGNIIGANTEEKCDFIVFNDEKRYAYLIELKGSDIDKAVNQLKNTANILESDLSGYHVFYRIIYSGKGTTRINERKLNNWKRSLGKTEIDGIPVVVKKSTEYKETIS